ncbi:arsenate reductase family protein [Pseudooceanicola sp. LIPI14-2-Ac024]|uniref:arsenate reductase family protein n=1 Tax=Pseudooceanicola sp. LIPI14-2-Ac024 TaxID=3344875 RepID=UPI0035D1211D
MVIYGIKTCDTCRKALKALEGSQLHDIRENGFPEGLLDRAAARFGTALLNTKSTTWRGLDAAERDRPMLDLIAEHPTLMKRPLIETGGDLYLGWTEATRSALGA